MKTKSAIFKVKYMFKVQHFLADLWLNKSQID